MIGASITGEVSDGNQTNQMNVILVADSDVLADPFFNIRSRGPDSDFPLDVDNVTLCLNLIDSLSGEDSLLKSETVEDCTVHWKNLKKVSKQHGQSHPVPLGTPKLLYNRFFRMRIESSMKL